MKTKLILFLVVFKVAIAEAQTTTIFFDDFDSSAVSKLRWHIPTWVSPTDGTYVGRTQFRCTPLAGLPGIINGLAVVNLDTYNPTGQSFYGTDLITNRDFTIGNGLIFTIRAKFKSPIPGGIVGGIFLYDLTGTGTNHDEIDFELVSNRPNEIQTNFYSNEPLGAGHPMFSSITGSITDFHTFVVKWSRDQIIWMIDGINIRTINANIPDRPMHFHLNIWAPDEGWAEGYNSNLQYTTSPELNNTYSLLVDFVKVDSVKPNSISEFKTEESGNYFYPNPVHDMIYFTSPDYVSVSIYNINGVMILSKQGVIDGKISVADLEPGLYFIRYKQKGIWKYSKLIKI